MMTTKRAASLATLRDERLMSGSLPLKKREFQPFKKMRAKSVLDAPHERLDYILSPLLEAISSNESAFGTTGLRSNQPQASHALVATVSRDTEDASTQLESTVENESVTKATKDVGIEDSDFSANEDSKLQDEETAFLCKGIQGQPSQRNAARCVQNPTRLSTPQDRRYTGSPNEARCLATTTRGRKCAYIAVHTTKYCNMHADYDTNPPLRRGAPKLKSKTKTRKQEHESAVLVDSKPVAQECSTTALPKFITSIPPFISEDSMDTSRVTPPLQGESPPNQQKKALAARRASSKLNKMHADSSCPLLSMISTDQWLQKRVRVAVGPLEGSIGYVKKWGNGWVSVNIPGVGIHNRRSFELYLHSHEEMDDVAEVKQSHLWSIRHEPDSPYPSRALTVSRTWTESNNKEVDAVVVTPRPGMISQTRVKSKNSPIPFLVRVDDASQTNLKDFETFNTISPPVSLRSCISEISNIPSIDSLSLSSDKGSIQRYKLGSLYGTAALDRSRRSIHRPARYEDTEIFANIHSPRKRSRSRGDEMNIEKRLRGLSI